MKIKSQTDVITNSSSETFIVKKPQEYTLGSFRRSLEDFTEMVYQPGSTVSRLKSQ